MTAHSLEAKVHLTTVDEIITTIDRYDRYILKITHNSTPNEPQLCR